MEASDTLDAIVVGGGPAGALTASLLARQGVRVLLLEKERFPRFHTGEALAPHFVQVLHRLGLEPKLRGRYQSRLGVRFLCSRTLRTQRFRFADLGLDTGVGLQVPRADFDDLLVQHAERCGALVRFGWRVRELRFVQHRAQGVVAVDRSQREVVVPARFVIDATGQDTLLAASKCQKSLPWGLDRIALYTHYAGAKRQTGANEGDMDIITFPHGWLWNLPFLGGVDSLGAVCSPTWLKARRHGETLESFFDRTVDDSPWSRELLGSARRMHPVQSQSGFSYAISPLAGEGWALVGDAAGFVDPLFASGLTLALWSAEQLVQLVLPFLLHKQSPPLEAFTGYAPKLSFLQNLYAGLSQAFYDGRLQDHIFEDCHRAPHREVFTQLLVGSCDDDSAPWLQSLCEQFPVREAPVASGR